MVSLRGILDAGSRISTQLYLGIGAAVLLTVVASLVGVAFFTRVGEVQSRVTNVSVPALATAFSIAQGGNALVAAAPRLVAAPTRAEFDRAARVASGDRENFRARLDALSHDDEQAARISSWGRALDSNIEAVQLSVQTRFAMLDQREALQQEMEVVFARLISLLIPAIDDQLFFAVTGYHSLGQPPVPRDQHLSEAAFARFSVLEQLRSKATVSNQIVVTLFTVDDASLLEPLRERLESLERDIQRLLDALAAGTFRDRVSRQFDELLEFGLGSRGGLDKRLQELALLKRQAALLYQNRALANELLVETERLVDAARSGAQSAALASTEAILTGRQILLVLSLFSVVGAVLIGWLFIGRVLVRRLQRLSDRMRRMADGDLEEEIDVSGRDEISEMSAALEVFRRHALEVQRLNLVEKLAEELQSKNEQLEETMNNLEAAQDQIVMREKLAALGELTAGVAHEIRNPLNFIKNYAESSQELMEEMMDEVRTLTGQADNDNEEVDEETRESRELIQEINDDLKGNLDIIRQHGQRADSIVRNMLLMGRGSGERQPTELNALLDEHTRLAYHSARATDTNFQMEITQDLDPEIGEIDVVPQDVGRVFLNMVSNACYATNDKRQRIRERQEAGETVEPYSPTLLITTRRLEEMAEVRLRDNGMGIPAEALDKIFNPFFTTKPTDKGTGLGLALSSDIIREHGGTIRVETEAGAFTEMIVCLPYATPAYSAGEDPEQLAQAG